MNKVEPTGSKVNYEISKMIAQKIFYSGRITFYDGPWLTLKVRIKFIKSKKFSSAKKNVGVPP